MTASGGNPGAHCWEAALRGETTPEVAAHLEECAECARMAGLVERAVAGVLDDIPAPDAAVDRRVMTAVEHASPGASGVRRVPSWSASQRSSPRRLLAGLGAAAMVIVVALALRGMLLSDSAKAVPIGLLTGQCPAEPGGAPVPGETRLVVAGVWRGREAERFAEVLERFEHRTGIQVAYAYQTHDIAATLVSRIKRGCPPDVALLPQPGLMAELARRRRIEPIDRFAGRLVSKGYGAPWRKLASVDGRLYGVWFKASNKSTFWYSRRAFQAAGIKRAPTSWSELLETARRLEAAGIRPFAVAGRDGWTLTDWFENLYLRNAGVRRYDRLARHEIPWTDPTVERALRRLAEVFGHKELVGRRDDVLHTTLERSVADIARARPRAAMVFEGDFVRSFIPRERAARDRHPSVDFFPFPDQEPESRPALIVGGDLAVTFSKSHPAQQLIRFLATPEAARPWASAGGFLSPNRRLDRSVYPDAVARRLAAALTAAGTVRFDLSDLQPPAFGATAEQGMWRIFQDFLEAPHEPDRTARRLEAAASAAFACERAIRGQC